MGLSRRSPLAATALLALAIAAIVPGARGFAIEVGFNETECFSKQIENARDLDDSHALPFRVMGAYVALFPRAKILLMIPIFIFPLLIPVSAVFGILVWFFLQLQSGALALADPNAAGGVAWWAHIGGFVAGLLLVVFFTPPRRRKPRVVYEVWDPVARRWRSIDL